MTIEGENFEDTLVVALYGGEPYIAGHCHTPDHAMGVFVNDNYAYVNI